MFFTSFVWVTSDNLMIGRRARACSSFVSMRLFAHRVERPLYSLFCYKILNTVLFNTSSQIVLTCDCPGYLNYELGIYFEIVTNRAYSCCVLKLVKKF